MCQMLVQIYTCEHQKPVCITPCPHALATYPNPFLGNPSESLPLNPQISSTTPLPVRQTMARWSIASISSYAPTMSSSSSQEAASPPPYASASNIPLCNSTADTLGHAHTPEIAPQANFCNYFFIRKAPKSRYPCIRCYLCPEHDKLRERWMKAYCITHPMTRPEDLEILSGVAVVAEQAGLVNVMREMDGMAIRRVSIMRNGEVVTRGIVEREQGHSGLRGGEGVDEEEC
ncbi:uncharacterized protein BDR25DRAFT_311974 [Lindgomyces ingoldianus]|uniref:Uncharacterized protein n=1 Tax=Lindgomyces ingoldianus TaxID=673940 RepID=A0ACB6R4S6_9PLEO|nr:uncharacterized protein BDR25DRAFT_311974 [Lindgomyces ingoldianus]KAF2473785.1 hypothetical protein BDR25DRAFT_311974 [Lindgomyces ingoldianus]